MNPQIFEGKAIGSKQEEILTMLVVNVTVTKWGKMNADKLFANVVAQNVRNHGIKLARRGQLSGGDRDFANVLIRKFSSVRNKPELYGNKVIVNESEMCFAVHKLIDRGLNVCLTGPELFSDRAIQEAEVKIAAVKEKVCR